jgi:uncharacterized OB-fold protein
MLAPNTSGIPVPRPTLESKPYWAGCRDSELRFRRCTRCGLAVFEPRPLCPRCHGTDLTWEVSAGDGSVYSWSIVWRPQTPAFESPYVPAIVTLDEGFDMLSAIVGCEPGDIGAGQRVRVEFHAVDDVITLPFFGPA